MKSKDSLYDLSLLPFTAYGSLSAILTTRDTAFEERNDDLYLSLTKTNSGNLERSSLARFSVLHDKAEIPYTYTVGYTKLRFDTEFGYLEFCYQDSILRIRGEGVSLRLQCRMEPHEGCCSREDGTYEAGFGLLGKFLFVPLHGTMDADAVWNWEMIRPDDLTFVFRPAEDGKLEAAIHAFLSNEMKLEQYPDFDDCVERNEKSLAEWAEKYPAVPAEFQDTAKTAVYIIWSHIMLPDGLLKDRVVYMSRNHLVNAFGWQQGYQAMAAWKDPSAAFQMLHNMFDYQLPEGQLPDFVNSLAVMYLCTKPPFQGFAATWILDHADLSGLAREQYFELYGPMVKWTEWWFNYRDTDHDGVMQYNHSDESGWDDSSMYARGFPLETADLAAFLVLQTEVLSRFAEKLGLLTDAKKWKEKSEELLSQVIDFWEKDRFVPTLSTTHEKVYSDSIAVYQPIILGKRLPQYMIDKIAEQLDEEGAYITEFGIASEKLDSPLLSLQNCFLRGNIVSPVQLMMSAGLYEAGKTELAEKIAVNFCRKVKRDGFALCHYPYDREYLKLESPDFNLAFGSDIRLATSWTAAVFLFLAGNIVKA